MEGLNRGFAIVSQGLSRSFVGLWLGFGSGLVVVGEGFGKGERSALEVFETVKFFLKF